MVAVSADTGVIPIGDVNGSVGSYGEVRRSEEGALFVFCSCGLLFDRATGGV